MQFLTVELKQTHRVEFKKQTSIRNTLSRKGFRQPCTRKIIM